MNTKDELKELRSQSSVLNERIWKLIQQVDIERLNSVVGKYFRVWIDDGDDCTHYFTVDSVDEFGIPSGRYYQINNFNDDVGFSKPGAIVGIGGFVTESSLKSAIEISEEEYTGIRKRLIEAL